MASIENVAICDTFNCRSSYGSKGHAANILIAFKFGDFPMNERDAVDRIFTAMQMLSDLELKAVHQEAIRLSVSSQPKPLPYSQEGRDQ